jgi:hypothetical protein
MLYVIGRVFSILFILTLKIAVDLFWFSVSPVMGVCIVLATLFLIYKTFVFLMQEKKERSFFKYTILNNMN